MYVNKANGLTYYETVEELLNQEITESYEDTENYYLSVPSDDFYANTIWVVNKKSKAVSDMAFTKWIVEIMDDTNPIDPDDFKRALRKGSFN